MGAEETSLDGGQLLDQNGELDGMHSFDNACEPCDRILTNPLPRAVNIK